MKTIDIESHFTDLDRSILENNVEYERYFKFVTHVLDAFTTRFAPKDGTQEQEVMVIRDLALRFLITLKALGLKYLFEDQDQMRIDLTASGFPNHMELRKLGADLELLKKGALPSVNVEHIKRQLLDKLIGGESDPFPLLRKLAASQYHLALEKGGLFSEFVPGNLRELKVFNAAQHDKRFLCSWASFDPVTNRPYVYLMVFDNVPDPDGPITERVDKDPGFVDMIKKCTHNTAPLKVIASDIDEACAWVHPKVLKRLDIGPILSAYDKSEDEQAKEIGEHIPSGHFVMHVTTEIVFSVGQEKKSTGLLSKSELREVFHVDETNKDCMERMASEVQSYLFTTHTVMQYLSDNQKEMLKQLSTPPFICPPVA
jgi:hypothetical protein